jgi:hypothetical protein
VSHNTGGDLARYLNRGELRSRAGAERSFYDLLRESGVGSDAARQLAVRGADVYTRQTLEGEPATTTTTTTTGRVKRRTPWPWEREK